jgi:hypothetical protein
MRQTSHRRGIFSPPYGPRKRVRRFPVRLSFWTQSVCILIARVASVSVGALVDSGYEYMLKQWLLSGRTDTKARDLCMVFPLYTSLSPDLWIYRPSFCKRNTRSPHLYNTNAQPPLCHRCSCEHKRIPFSHSQLRTSYLLSPWCPRSWCCDTPRRAADSLMGSKGARTDVLDPLRRFSHRSLAGWGHDAP